MGFCASELHSKTVPIPSLNEEQLIFLRKKFPILTSVNSTRNVFSNNTDPILAAIRSKINEVMPPWPGQFQFMMALNFISAAYVDAQYVTKEQFEALMTNTWKLPEDVKAKFRTIAYSASTRFETFYLNVWPLFPTMTYYIGAAQMDPETGIIHAGLAAATAMCSNCIMKPDEEGWYIFIPMMRCLLEGCCCLTTDPTLISRMTAVLAAVCSQVLLTKISA
jgi:hypothetical protein